MGEDFKSDVKAPFNMAINTLERLGEILTQIRKVSSDPFMPSADKQLMKVSLSRQFFIQASPLLNEDVVKDYEEKLLSLKPQKAKITKNGKPTGQEKIIFNSDLDNTLDQFVLQIQRELQKERYFMPPKKDKGRAVAEF